MNPMELYTLVSKIHVSSKKQKKKKGAPYMPVHQRNPPSIPAPLYFEDSHPNSQRCVYHIWGISFDFFL